MIAAAAVVATGALAGVQFDADATGRALLGWNQKGQVRWVEVVDGKPLARPRVLARTTLADLDVSPAGAVAVCLRDAKQVKVVRRSPAGVWAPALTVATPRVRALSCAIGDAGDVTVAWRTQTGAAAAHVGADGSVERPTRLAGPTVSTPQTTIAPDGTARVAFSQGSNPLVYVAERPAAGPWSARAIAGGTAPRIDGTLLGWSDGTLRVADAPAFTPASLGDEPSQLLVGLATNPRGDALAVSRGLTLRASLRRSGGAFAAPVELGSVGGTVSVALADDGTGGVSWGATTRLLAADGTWSAPIARGGLIVAAPGGRVTAAWVTKRKLRVGTL